MRVETMQSLSEMRHVKKNIFPVELYGNYVIETWQGQVQVITSWVGACNISSNYWAGCFIVILSSSFHKNGFTPTMEHEYGSFVINSEG